MNRSSVVRTAALLAAVPLFVAACSSSADADDPAVKSAESADEPRAGGTLRVALDSDPGCLDPGRPSLVPAVTRNIVDSLLDRHPETGEFVPWLAESWDVNEDATSFTFTLREDVTFSDGTPLDAEVVKANFDTLVELGAQVPGAVSALAGYVDTTVTDELTLVVEFDRPNAGFLEGSSSRVLGILAPETLEKSTQERCQGDLIGTGPFVLDSYTPDQGATLTKREGYAWGSGARENQGEAYLDGIEYQVIEEAGVRNGMLESGQVEVIDVLPHDEDQFENHSDAYLAVKVQAGVGSMFHPNLDHPVLQDEAVRKAILIGIDREQIVDSVFSERHPVSTSVLSQVQPGYVDLSSELGYEPEAAADILEEAGWTLGADGIREKDGGRLEVDIIIRGMGPVVELAQQHLRDIGIDLEIRQLTSAEYTETEDRSDFGFSFGQQARPDVDVLRMLYSSRGVNRYNMPPSELDDLLDAIAAETDPAARDELAADAQRFIIEHGYTIPVYEGLQVHAASNRVQGLVYDMSSVHVFGDTWLTE